jgi:hypothetical protein
LPRRRLKELRDPAYTRVEAEASAGLGVDNRQRGVEEVVKRMEGMPGLEEDKGVASTSKEGKGSGSGVPISV